MTSEEEFSVWTVALLALSIFIAAGALLRYWFYRYQVLDDGIQIHQGALFKKHLNLKFSRVQNVNIRHPFYFRPLGLVTLKIDGAGSAGEEVNIAALTLDSAQLIRQTIQDKKRDLVGAGVVESASDSGVSVSAGDGSRRKAQPFYTRSFADLVIHGLTNNRAWIIVGAIIGFLQSTPFSITDGIELLGATVGSLISDESLAFGVVLFSLALVLTVAITALLSVMGSIVTYYGFQLYRSGASLMVHRGLLTRHELNMQKSRVQTIYLRQDWLDLVLERVNVIFEQISHSPHNVEGAETSKRILVPSVRQWESGSLVREIFAVPDVQSLEFEPVSKRYFYKYALILSLLYLLLILALASFAALSLVVLLVWLLHTVLLYLRWLRKGLALTGDYVVVRRGIIGIDYIVLPAYKLQVLDHVQSVLMKRRGLSDIVFHSASRTVSVPHLPTSVVQRFINHCLYHVEATDRSWM